MSSVPPTDNHPAQDSNQPTYASPPPPHYAARQPGNGLAVAGFVLSIVAAVFFWVIFFSYWAISFNVVCWVLGIVFSSIGFSRANKQGLPNKGLAIAGLSVCLGGFALLIAVGALVAVISDNAHEDLERVDLERVTPSLESVCNEVEVFDPILAANGKRGRAGSAMAGVDGSDTGCRPVCIFIGTGRPTTIEFSEINYARNHTTSLDAISNAGDFAYGDILVFRNPRALAHTDDTDTDIAIENASFGGALRNKGAVEVRVIPGRNACGIFDESGKQIRPN